MAIPPGYQGTLYAQGTGVDGLDYMRDIVARLPTVLNPGGPAYLVADFCGDAQGPYLFAELERFAVAGGMRIDGFIDHVLPASAQVEPMTAFLEHATKRPARATDVEAFQRDILRAEHYFLTTLRVQTAVLHPGLRVMHRHSIPARHQAEQWPTLLRSA